MSRSLCVLLLGVLAAQDAKIAVPGEADIKKAELIVKTALSRDFAGATSRTGRRDLAKKLVAQSDGAKDPAERFVLLRDAIENAAAGMDFPSAFRTIDLLARTFAVNADELMTGLLAKARKAPMTADDATFLAETCLMAWESYMQAEKYDAAGRWAKEAETVAKLARDQILMKAAADMGIEAQDAKKAMERSALAVAAGGVDPDSNLAVGSYLCFFRNDWLKGLPFLASGSNVMFQDLAKKEGLAAGDPDAQAEVSLAWTALADKEKDPGAKRRYYVRARFWKEQALKGLTGLAKTKAVRKLLPIVVITKATYGPKGDVTKQLQDVVDAMPGSPIMVDAYLAGDFGVAGGPNLVVEYTVDGQKRRDVANVGDLLFLPPMPPHGTPLPTASFRFNLLAAYYGSGAKMIDVTPNVRRVITDPFAQFSTDASGADTTPFRVKSFALVAELHGRRVVRVLRQGGVSDTLMR